ncbi:MAG: sigma-70 family RNA polymerase sigma factor [Clostridiales bacterium]|nr:sigma-70 family RNA polymerase sigma factor [Clostridiales bacterium]
MDKSRCARKTEIFQNIWARHHDTVFAYVLASLNHDSELADDCMQDIVALVLTKMDVVAKHPNPGGFFIVTAKNYIHKYRALRRREIQRNLPFDETTVKAAYEVDFDAIFDRPVNIEKFKREILNKLDFKEMELYQLFYEDGLKISEIAGRLKISESNVKVRLFRLRAKVRKQVTEIFARL